MTFDVDHFSLAVSDLEAAITFFSQGFGFKQHFVERGMTGQIASMLGLGGASCDLAQLVLGDGGPRLELIAFRHDAVGAAPSHPMTPGMGHLALKTCDFATTLDRLRRLGAEPLGDITQFSEGRSVYLRLPFGAFLELEEAGAENPASPCTGTSHA
ncbi:MAG: VOC family protein [Parvibaculaceae bacterium]